MKNATLFLVLFSFLICGNSCKEDEQIVDDNDFAIAKNYAIAERSIEVLMNIVSEEILKQPSLNGGYDVIRDTCFNTALTHKPNPEFYPANLRLGYEKGCIYREHTVSGVIQITITYDATTGSTYKVALENVKINNNALKGDMSFTNKSYEFNNCTVTKEDGQSVVYNKLKATRTQIEGVLTTVKLIGRFAFADDVYLYSLAGDGKNSVAKPFSVLTSYALRSENSCKWFTKGDATYISDIHRMVLDYGTGNCDSKLNVTISNLKSSSTSSREIDVL